MKRWLTLLMVLALAAPLAQAQDKPAARAGHTAITWDELVPADWDPLKQFKDMNFGVLSDADPRAAAACGYEIGWRGSRPEWSFVSSDRGRAVAHASPARAAGPHACR